jgi:hypothetical protein
MSSQSVPVHYDVIIIGGGMAGVSTSYHLLKQQQQQSSSSPCSSILLLEARNRLGGRIHAIDLPSCTVELGANWIHGIIGNPIADLALKYKLADPLGNEATHQDKGVNGKRYIVQAIREDGKKVDLNLVEQVYDAYFWFMKQIESYHSVAEKEGKDPPVEYGNSVGQHLIHDIEKYLNAKDEKDWIQVRKAIFKNLLHREAIISGSHSISDVSLRDFGAYDDFPGGNLIVDAGYISIINVLLDEIDNMISELRTSSSSKVQPSSSNQMLFDVQLEKEVVKIKWRNVTGISGQKSLSIPAAASGGSSSRSHSPSSSCPSESLCEIACQDGSRYTCHHAVITLPLGVLKETSELMFDPPLPEYKIQSIQSLGFSDVTKIFLEFKNKLSPKFLDPAVNELLLVWADDDDEDEIESDTTTTTAVSYESNNNNNNDESINSGDNKKKKHNTKIILKKDSPKNWFRTIYSLTKVSDYALLGWLSGQDAEFVESLDPEAVAKVMTEEILRKFFHPEFPEPESVFMTKWSSERFTRGAYTFIPTTASIHDIDKLSQPIYSDPGQEKVCIFCLSVCDIRIMFVTQCSFNKIARSAVCW